MLADVFAFADEVAVRDNIHADETADNTQALSYALVADHSGQTEVASADMAQLALGAPGTQVHTSGSKCPH